MASTLSAVVPDEVPGVGRYYYRYPDEALPPRPLPAEQPAAYRPAEAAQHPAPASAGSAGQDTESWAELRRRLDQACSAAWAHW